MAAKTLYISDLDGTLLTPEQKLTPYTIEIINRLSREGMLFSYATARSLVTAAPVTQGLPDQLPVIVYNGSFILRQGDGQMLASSAFPPQERQDIIDALRRLSLPAIVYSYVDGKECFSYLPDTLTPGMEAFVKARTKDPRRRMAANTDELYAGEVFYFTLINNRDPLCPFFETFQKDPRFQILFQQDIYSEHYWCEIMPATATKAQAALKLKALLGCDRLVAFGDAMNDATLFSVADECYAVANAHPDLKAMATAVIGANTEDGVARWLAEHV